MPAPGRDAQPQLLGAEPALAPAPGSSTGPTSTTRQQTPFPAHPPPFAVAPAGSSPSPSPSPSPSRRLPPAPAMLTFAPPAAPLRPPPPAPRAPRRHAAKRLRMASADRTPEFSLGDPAAGPGHHPARAPPDWPAWRAAGRPMPVPAIPFPPPEVFLPGEAKRLHLFEARYLALFETVVAHFDNRCAHVLVDAPRQAMAAFGTIAHVRSWRRLDVGVSVEFEAVGRLKTAKMRNAAPFLWGDFEPVDDHPLEGNDATRKVQIFEQKFWAAFREVVALSLKLGDDPVREKLDTATPTIDAVEGRNPPEPPGTSQPSAPQQSLVGDNSMFLLSTDAKKEFFEQKLKQAARRAVNFDTLDFGEHVQHEEMLARRARALSFAGWDFFPSHHILRQRAIEERDTLARLALVVTGLEQQAKKLAAKIAVQSAFSE